MKAPSTTGIGSVPFADEASAVTHVFNHYDVPFFPQLVRHPRYLRVNAPQMLQEAVPASVLESLLTTDSSLDPSEQAWRQALPDHISNLPGWKLFNESLKSSNVQLCKLQLCGPETAIRITEHLIGKEMPASLHSLFHRMIVEQAQAMITQVRAQVPRCIFLWDEGEALIHGTAAALSRLDGFCAAIEGKDVVSGVHCCAPFDLEAFLTIARGRYLAIDLTLSVFRGFQAADLLAKIATQGGLIAGTIDTQADDVKYEQARATYAFARQLLQNNDGPLPHMISGACGSGLKTTAFEAAMAKCLRSLVRLSH